MSAAPSPALTSPDRLRLYRQMHLVRRFDERVMELFGQGLIKGTAHACCGQEASAVGVCAALGPHDQVSSTHRGHGHLIAKGGCVDRLMAELFGKETGYSRGRGGSQHVAAYEVGFLGSNGITAGGLPIATGAALAIAHRQEPHVVVAFFGEGATGQGAFHEAVNLGAAWKLPIVYVCENNLYAMGTVISQTSPVPHVADRAQGYGIPGVVVDGNDLDAVYAATVEAVTRARAGAGPSLLECKTYRIYGHSKGDSERVYRTRAEEATWAAHDPLVLAAARLRADGLLDDASDAALVAAVYDRIEQAVEFAKTSPDPDPAAAATGVFAGE
ncbi:MAG: thiamine pyrophosphate-dependent dehydrogenase E1 component subunit alpha [Fimbriimonadaceae bacterium]|nr:thiamine pyrophosphate-dependent dehydrogenase E1 component subunit alpha [Fimbriimonadaceae bacterium]